MWASTLAWILAIIFTTAGLEKTLMASTREEFVDTVRSVPLLNSPVFAYLFLSAELLTIPALLVLPRLGLYLLTGLTVIVSLWAVIAWLRGEIKSCGCGGIWAVDGRNLLIRNGVMLIMAVYALLAAPTPLNIRGLVYAVFVILAFIVVAGIVEAVRIRLRTG